MVMQAQFDPFRIAKFGVGFDSVIDRIQSDFFTDSFQGTQNFPPYNIIKRDGTSYDIEMAVAGFAEEDLDIEYADNVLTVSSKDSEIKCCGIPYAGVSVAHGAWNFKAVPAAPCYPRPGQPRAFPRAPLGRICAGTNTRV